MKYTYIGLLTLGIAVMLTVLVVQQKSGYVLVNYNGWSIETSFHVFALLSVLSFVGIYAIVRMLFVTWHLSTRLSFWQHNRLALRARRVTNQGLIALAEGNWRRAEKLLAQSAAHSETPLINYLGAAQAAQKQGSDLRRDEHLSQAIQSMPDAELAVGLTQAEAQLSHGQAEQALATLHHLRDIAPKHVQVLYLLKRLYEKLQSWDELFALLDELRKHRVLEPEAMTTLEFQVHHHRIMQSKTLDQLEKKWRQVPRGLHQSPQLLLVYANCLTDLGAGEKAEPLLNDFLKQHWDPAVIRLFGQIDGGDATRQLATAERWLQEYKHHPELLLTLGRLCLRNKLWGKARSYLEASLGAKPMAETCCELGNLLQQLGDKEKAADYFRQGLELASGNQCTRFTVPKQNEALHDKQDTSSPPKLDITDQETESI